MSLAVGERLGPYAILDHLGAGGMGEVWRAVDTRLGREAAIKVSPAPLSYLACTATGVCTAPGVAATLNMANAIVGMIFMRASPKTALATIARPLPHGSVLVWFASC